jgi:3(or 17)beta-hydroxysteroid dehydrogenase
MKSLDHKVALVLGATGGIGAAVVKHLAEAGATVFATSASIDVTSQQSVTAMIRLMRLDITDEADWSRAVDTIKAEFGGIDVLVNCAALLEPGLSIETTSIESWRRTFRVNAEGAFLACRYAVDLMKHRPGASIINIASGGAVRVSSHSPAYGASKAAMVALTKSVALHCAEHNYGIRANVILPGAVDTPMLRRNIACSSLPEKDYLEKIRKLHPIGRIGMPADIAAAVLFLASDDSSFMTGAEMVVDGGQML